MDNGCGGTIREILGAFWYLALFLLALPTFLDAGDKFCAKKVLAYQINSNQTL